MTKVGIVVPLMVSVLLCLVSSKSTRRPKVMDMCNLDNECIGTTTSTNVI